MTGDMWHFEMPFPYLLAHSLIGEVCVKSTLAIVHVLTEKWDLCLPLNLKQVWVSIRYNWVSGQQPDKPPI